MIREYIVIDSCHGLGLGGRPPCGRHGLFLGPLSFVAVMDLAVIVCGRYGFGSHSLPCGRHGLWPS